jgi:peptidoglycan hydrolase CwlO-like protein
MANQLMSLEEIERASFLTDRHLTFDEYYALIETARAAHEWKADAEGLAQRVRDANEVCNELQAALERAEEQLKQKDNAAREWGRKFQEEWAENEKLRALINATATALEEAGRPEGELITKGVIALHEQLRAALAARK